MQQTSHRKLTKREKRRQKTRTQTSQPQINLLDVLADIRPKTENQRRVFESYDEGQNQVLIGCPGTGKTFLAMYLALSDLLEEGCDQKRIVIIRSVVQGRDMGALPGTAKEKAAAFEKPYEQACNELFGSSMKGVYSLLKTQGKIEFETTSFLRGTNMDETIIVIDEVQNMTAMELHSVVTRYGRKSRLIMCGDVMQNDLITKKGTQGSGLEEALDIFRTMPSVDVIEFQPEDIVRSGFVKEYVLAKLKLGL